MWHLHSRAKLLCQRFNTPPSDATIWGKIFLEQPFLLHLISCADSQAGNDEEGGVKENKLFMWSRSWLLCRRWAFPFVWDPHCMQELAGGGGGLHVSHQFFVPSFLPWGWQVTINQRAPTNDWLDCSQPTRRCKWLPTKVALLFPITTFTGLLCAKKGTAHKLYKSCT